MIMAEDCTYCKIVLGELPCTKLCETDNFIVIKDIHPKTKGHSLIISKKHYKNILAMPSIAGSELLDVVKGASLNLMSKEKAEGFNLVVNTCKAAGQVVEHFHLHILLRYSDDGFKFGI